MLAIQLLSSLSCAPEGLRRGALYRVVNMNAETEAGTRKLRGVQARMGWVERQFGSCVKRVTEMLLIDLGYRIWDHEYPRIVPLIPWLGREVRDLKDDFTGGWKLLESACELDEAGDDDGEIVLGAVKLVPRLSEDVRTIIDWYVELDERPDILRMDMKEAYDIAHAWHEQLKVNAEKGMPRPGVVVLDLGSVTEGDAARGWTLQDLDTRKRIEAEGKVMGHCVSGRQYWDQVRDGHSKIYSLRDPAGRPWVTWQVTTPEGAVSPEGASVSISQVKGRGNLNVASYEPGRFDGLDDVETCDLIRDLAVIASGWVLTGVAEIDGPTADRLKSSTDLALSVAMFGKPSQVVEGDEEADEDDEQWEDRYPPVLACPNCGNDLSYEIGAFANVGRRIHIEVTDGRRSQSVIVSGGDPYDWELSEVRMECHDCGHVWDFPRGEIQVRYY
jgi:hypothetical protein